MSVDETFFTVIGCMDGRCVDPVEDYGRQVFSAKYADTITEPGIVGLLSKNPPSYFLASLKEKILISLNKHKSKGIIIDGHSECAGDPIPDELQREEIKKSVEVIRQLVGNAVPVIGVFITRKEVDGYATWNTEEVTVPKILAKASHAAMS